ncbi:MAG: type II toxin-antitoxin system prevent-host-death family antitoxin [Caldilineaceae bacterium]
MFSGVSNVVVTRNNKETVAIIPYEDYGAIAEALK